MATTRICLLSDMMSENLKTLQEISFTLDFEREPEDKKDELITFINNEIMIPYHLVHHIHRCHLFMKTSPELSWLRQMDSDVIRRRKQEKKKFLDTMSSIHIKRIHHFDKLLYEEAFLSLQGECEFVMNQIDGINAFEKDIETQFNNEVIRFERKLMAKLRKCQIDKEELLTVERIAQSQYLPLFHFVDVMKEIFLGFQDDDMFKFKKEVELIDKNNFSDIQDMIHEYQKKYESFNRVLIKERINRLGGLSSKHKGSKHVTSHAKRQRKY